MDWNLRTTKRPVFVTLASLVIGFAMAMAGAVFAVAIAQITLPFVQKIAPKDAISIIPGGSPSAQSFYAGPGDIAGQEKYSYQVPLTAFTITPPNFTSLLYLNPAGTLATGTLILQANPSDRQKFCLEDSQTQTAITISANTGQTLAAYGVATPTALVANTLYCWFFNGPQSAWVQTR